MRHELSVTDEEFRILRSLVMKRREELKSKVNTIEYICDEDERDLSSEEESVINEYNNVKDLDRYLFGEAIDSMR